MASSPHLFRMITRAQLRCVKLLLGAFLLPGCSSSQMSRIDANRELYESWPLEMRQAVLDGKVEPGMNRDMVRMVLGQPTEILTKAAGINEDEIWVYRTGGDEGGTGMGMGNPGLSMGGSLGGLNVGSGGGMGPTMGIGTGMGSNMGISAPIMSAPVRTPAEEREIVFQDGVVLRAEPGH